MDDGAVAEHFDLPPGEWRWQKDGPADRGGSTLSAAATQCRIQLERAVEIDFLLQGWQQEPHIQSQRSKVQGKSSYNLTTLAYFLRPCVHAWRGVLTINRHNTSVNLPAACHWCFPHFSDRIVCLFVALNIFRLLLSAWSEVWLKRLVIYHTINAWLVRKCAAGACCVLASQFFGPFIILRQRLAWFSVKLLLFTIKSWCQNSSIT